MSTAQPPSLIEFFAQAQSAFERASGVHPPDRRMIRVAGQHVALWFASPALHSMLMPALAHLNDVVLQREPDISFYLWDTASTSIPAPRPPFTAADYHRYSQRAVVDDGRFAIMHTPAVPILFAYDREARHGFCWTADADQLSIYERAAPFQTLLHWALCEFGWQIVHAAAVGTEQGGVLLVGNTGAGKSTTALSCLTRAGIKFLCDDKCLVRLAPAPQAFAAFSSGKIKADMLKHLPQFRSMVTGWDDNYKAGKGLVFLHPAYADHMVQSFPIKALLLPKVTHQAGATIRPTTATSTFRQLGPSTVIWLPGAEADNYRFTADLTRQLPCYQLELALDLQRNTDAILDLLAKL